MSSASFDSAQPIEIQSFEAWEFIFQSIFIRLQFMKLVMLERQGI